MRRLFLSLLLFSLAIGSVSGQDIVIPDADKQEPDKQEPELPPGREVYLGRRIAYTMGVAGAPWLIRKNRQQEEDCNQQHHHPKATKRAACLLLGCITGHDIGCRLCVNAKELSSL